MKFFYYILAIVVGVTLFNYGNANPMTDFEESHTSSTDGEKSQNDAIRTSFKIPEFFNFTRFKQMFDKHYSSFIEELVRKKIFLGRCFASFISMFKYKHRQVSHFLRINQMSDETPEERLMRYPDPESMRIPDSELAGLTTNGVLKADLTSVKYHMNKQDQKSLSEEQLLRTTRSLEVDSSTGNSDGQKKSRIDLSSVLTNFKEVPIVATSIKTIQKMYNNNQVESDMKEPLSDMMYIDHREKKCHFLPRYQDNCGCCYAFATIALFEYVFCVETGLLVPFSEQYMVDCGYREGLNACEGARIDLSLRFLEKYGLEFRAEYPYLGKNGTCPYNQDTSPIQMGTIKVDSMTYSVQPIGDIKVFLMKRPVVTGITVTPDFADYGGGVDDAPNCDGGGHGMLVVGYGREDGKDFYLFRNSHSVTWGELGYYKLNAESLERCALSPYIFITDSTFAEVDKNMNKHNLVNIKAHHNNLLLNQELF